MTGAAVRLLDDDGSPLHYIVARWHQLHDELCVSLAKPGKLLQQLSFAFAYARTILIIPVGSRPKQNFIFVRSKFNADGCPMDQEDWNGDNGVF